MKNNQIYHFAQLNDIYGGSKEQIKKLLTKSHKLTSLSLAGKMLSFILVFSFTPVSADLKINDYNTNLKLDANKPQILVLNETKTNIESGEANIDRIAREQKLIESNSFVCAYDDPTDFRPIYQDAGKQFNVPWQIIEAVHQVESGKSGSTTTRSYAGAQGPMQFMPGTWRAYGVDGNGDGVADITDVTDAIYGAANLLAHSGAAEGRIDDALFNYNHAQWYVDKVKDVAYSIGGM